MRVAVFRSCTWIAQKNITNNNLLFLNNYIGQAGGRKKIRSTTGRIQCCQPHRWTNYGIPVSCSRIVFLQEISAAFCHSFLFSSCAGLCGEKNILVSLPRIGNAADMRIVTWNINSLRLRMPLLARLCQDTSPDIVCLQETKVPDALFPLADVRALGFGHVVFRGMKGYNGVAILSRQPVTVLEDTPDWCEKGDCRHIAVRHGTGDDAIDVHDFYVPAGAMCPTRSRTPNSPTSWLLWRRRASGSRPAPCGAPCWWAT